MTFWHEAVQFNGVSVSSNCLRGELRWSGPIKDSSGRFRVALTLERYITYDMLRPNKLMAFLVNKCQVVLVHCTTVGASCRARERVSESRVGFSFLSLEPLSCLNDPQRLVTWNT